MWNDFSLKSIIKEKDKSSQCINSWYAARRETPGTNYDVRNPLWRDCKRNVKRVACPFTTLPLKLIAGPILINKLNSGLVIVKHYVCKQASLQITFLMKGIKNTFKTCEIYPTYLFYSPPTTSLFYIICIPFIIFYYGLSKYRIVIKLNRSM